MNAIMFVPNVKCCNSKILYRGRLLAKDSAEEDAFESKRMRMKQEGEDTRKKVWVQVVIEVPLNLSSLSCIFSVHLQNIDQQRTLV